MFVACRFWLSLLLLLATAVLAFAVLLTVSERFFCPALELISDYLKLPPVVAGATLLSFGNGAPDTFTQVAAVGQVGAGEWSASAGTLQAASVESIAKAMCMGAFGVSFCCHLKGTLDICSICRWWCALCMDL
jgi:hypothetical protein